MKLYESEGKGLFERFGIKVPQGKVVASVEEATGLTKRYGSVMAKAQVLWGRRAKQHGVIPCEDEDQLATAIKSLLGTEMFGETIERVLVEQKRGVVQEMYLGVTYTGASPVVIVSGHGGIDVEEASHEAPEGVFVEHVNILRGLEVDKAEDLMRRVGLGDTGRGAADVLLKLYRMFTECDATLAEINPLLGTGGGEWVAADAKVEIDDDALFRQGSLGLPERLSSGRTPTHLERLALENDRRDTRGSAGRMFHELDGNIVVLASGGGTSVEALDDLCLLGGKPAVFTEYSGNPSPEKVKGLTRIALMYPGGIDAIWVVGGRANFTDIYDTLINGIMAGIRETPGFDRTIPIIIRRAGPRDEEAFAALHKLRQEEGYNLFLRGMATSVADSARMVIHQANKHRETQ